MADSQQKRNRHSVFVKIWRIYYNIKPDVDCIWFYFIANGVDHLKERRITSGIREAVPRWLQNMMWFMADSMDVSEKNFCQIFCLSEEDKMQKIEHSQKYPPYHKTIVLPSDGLTINTKIIILESEKSLTMMLNSKY